MMNQLRWMGGAFALLLGGLALLWVVRPDPTSAIIPPASVAAFSGDAYACDHYYGCTTQAAFGQQVFSDGEARTGPNGTLDLQTRTTIFRLTGESTLHFQEVSDAVTVATLWLGRLFVSHDPQGRDMIQVQAGGLTIVALDTRFSVELSDQGVYIAVPPGGGRVRVQAALGSVEVPAGYEVQVPANPVMLPVPQPIRADEVTRWDVVSCDWQGIVAVLTPGALPAAASGCGIPPALTDTPVPPPTDTALPVPTDTPLPTDTPVLPATDTPLPPPPTEPPFPTVSFPTVPLPPPLETVTPVPPPATDTPVPPAPTDTPYPVIDSTGTPVPVQIDTPTDTPIETPTTTPTLTPTITDTPTLTPTATVVPPTLTPTPFPPPANAGDYANTWYGPSNAALRSALGVTPSGNTLIIDQYDVCIDPANPRIVQHCNALPPQTWVYNGQAYQYGDFLLVLEYFDPQNPSRKRLVVTEDGHDPLYYSLPELN